MVLRIFLITSLFWTTSLSAQTWGNLNGLLARTFGPGIVGAYWLPDSFDPGQATVALAIVYSESQSGGNVPNIAAAVFDITPQGFAKTHDISGVFGASPREAFYSGTHIELTTTMPGPKDPRCCPTVPTRWRIDRATGAVMRLN